jgi:CRISPR-associated exonuclease Cas4
VFTEDELLPISALQHLLFCERQCALIHIEGQWAENRLTVEGKQLHERADGGSGETHGAVRIARGMPLRSLRLGLVGKADVVEFHAAAEAGVTPLVLPVEYKRGRPKRDGSDSVQLCAQALCLEEMLQVDIPAGALFYGTTRRRTDVVFDRQLRERTEIAAARLHSMIAAGVTPRAQREAKCDSCSLLNICLPDSLSSRRSASRYVERALRRSFSIAAQDEEIA